ncbi:MAG: pantetheine-phosphate adenylyltransferase [Bacteroidota bacterium]
MKIAIFPGSFDPITVGHVEIAQRAANLFDKLVIAIGTNSKKKGMFSVEERLSMMKEIFRDQPNVEVSNYTGLTVNFARENKAKFILRGIRNAEDLAYEETISFLNQHMHPELETVYLHSSPKTVHVSSSIIREIIRYKGKLEGLVPDEVIEVIKKNKY